LLDENDVKYLLKMPPEFPLLSTKTQKMRRKQKTPKGDGKNRKKIRGSPEEKEIPCKNPFKRNDNGKLKTK